MLRFRVYVILYTFEVISVLVKDVISLLCNLQSLLVFIVYFYFDGLSYSV
jgi:hypothetical protein